MLGFKVVGLRIHGLLPGLRDPGLKGFGYSFSLGFRVQGLGFRV